MSANPPAHQSGNLLTARIQHRVGALNLNLEFTLSQPWTVLFGPSGSGKTTILRAIAGFVRPEGGRIEYRTNVLVDRDAGRFVPPHSRPIRSLGQRARLFPNMTVAENISYGCGWHSKSADAPQIVNEIMELFRLQGLSSRDPRNLSGGESQRVSVARALLAATTFDGPGRALLLLDEPFAGLNLDLRDELLREVQAWVEKWHIPVLSVTHDVGEAFLLSAEVIKLHDGRITAQGPVAEVLVEERNRLLKQLALS